MSLSSTRVRKIIVLTPFNLKPPKSWGVPDRTLDRDWLEYRLQLSERTSAQSLSSQTCSNFEQVIFINPQTPSFARKALLSSPRDGATRLVEFGGTRDRISGTELREFFEEDEWLTIRLDSDDALSRTFIEEANKHSRRGVYSFDYGAYLTEKQGIIVRRRYPNNPFLFQIADRGIAVIDTGHHLIHVDHEIRTSEPMWLQVHHGTNVSPSFRGIRPLRADYASRYFDIAAHQIRDPKVLDRLYYLPVNALVGGYQAGSKRVRAKFERALHSGLVGARKFLRGFKRE